MPTTTKTAKTKKTATTKGTAKTKSSKAPKTATTKKTVAATNGVKQKATPELRARAKAMEMSTTHLRVLEAIYSLKEASYRDIDKVTGIYNPLTRICRAGHDGSLAERKLIKELTREAENGKGVLHFQITKTGENLLKKHK